MIFSGNIGRVMDTMDKVLMPILYFVVPQNYIRYLFGRHRSSYMISLYFITPIGAQKIKLLLHFDTLRNHP